ncbi:MAG: Holliday junction resolvase RuvX [Alphaproteobacteria bacterium]
MAKKKVFVPTAEFWSGVQTLEPTSKPRLLGLDLGSKTIGIAIADSALVVASPLHTIRRTKFTNDRLELEEFIKTYEINGLVFGWPLNMDGSEGPRCQATRDFARNLQGAGVMVPMTTWDERMTTQAIQRFLIDEQDMNRKRRAQVVDKMAAALILQAALDARLNYV